MLCTFNEIVRFKNSFKEILKEKYLACKDIKLNLSFQVDPLKNKKKILSWIYNRNEKTISNWIYNDPFIVEIQFIYQPFILLKKKSS